MRYITGLLLSLLIIFSFSSAFGGERIPDADKALAALKKAAAGSFHMKWDSKRGVAAYVSGRLTKPSGLGADELAVRFLKRYGALFGIKDPAAELVKDRVDNTNAGTIVRFSQRKNGLDVVGGGVIVRISDGMVRTVANHFEPRLSVPAAPSISKQEALDAASTAAGQKPVDASLLILSWEGMQYLAYSVDFPFVEAPKPSKYRAYVDASTGEVILMENRVVNNGPAVGTGLGVDGVLKSFDTYNIGGTFYLGNLPIPGLNIKIKTYTANNTGNIPGTILTDADNYWTDPAAVDAHFYGNFVFDFYKNNFSNFTWFAGSGFKRSGGLISSVHYKTGYDNAFWDGSQMVYGDGGTLFYPLSGALDVVAHEITHGVTEAINNLTYCKESGALNESWSDVMGMFASIDYGDDLPYWAAEEIMKIAQTPGNEAYYALRRLDDPPFRTDIYPANDYDPTNPLGSWGQPEHTSEQYHAGCWPWTDWGGVHVNSGIPNKAAYLITVDIGAAKAKQIYYLAMFYLTSNSRFTDARAAVEQATIDLYGVGPELTSVQTAFTTVGIP